MPCAKINGPYSCSISQLIQNVQVYSLFCCFFLLFCKINFCKIIKIQECIFRPRRQPKMFWRFKKFAPQEIFWLFHSELLLNCFTWLQKSVLRSKTVSLLRLCSNWNGRIVLKGSGSRPISESLKTTPLGNFFTFLSLYSTDKDLWLSFFSAHVAQNMKK